MVQLEIYIYCREDGKKNLLSCQNSADVFFFPFSIMSSMHPHHLPLHLFYDISTKIKHHHEVRRSTHYSLCGYKVTYIQPFAQIKHLKRNSNFLNLINIHILKGQRKDTDIVVPLCPFINTREER